MKTALDWSLELADAYLQSKGKTSSDILYDLIERIQRDAYEQGKSDMMLFVSKWCKEQTDRLIHIEI